MAQTLYSYAELNKDFSLHLTCSVIPIVKTPLKLQRQNLIIIVTKNSFIEISFTLYSLTNILKLYICLCT